MNFKMAKMIPSKRNLAFCLAIFVLALVLTIPIGNAFADNKTYTIGLTPVFLADRTAFIKQWREYLTRKLNSSVRFVQRQTYQEITDLLLSGELDAAWLCGYPFVVNKDELKLLSVPTFRGKPLYQSYLIVAASDNNTKSIIDLKNKVFVYSDPDSNSGFLYPQVDMLKNNINPRYFFKKTFFAWSHQDVVKAVAEGVAHAGSVDGYVWETIANINPALAQQTRIVSKSQEFGFPPFVINRKLNAVYENNLRQSLLTMKDSNEGQVLLKRLNLDGFIIGNNQLYDGIAELIETLKSRQ